MARTRTCERRAGRYDAAFLDRCGAGVASSCPGHGSFASMRFALGFGRFVALDSICAEHASGAVGRCAIFSAWLAITTPPRAEYVYAHLDGNRRRLLPQRDRDAGA